MIRRTSYAVVIAAIIAGGFVTQSAHAAGEPTIMRAVTGDDGDGHLDSLTVTFSTSMQGTTPTSSWFADGPADEGFLVEGYTIVGATWVAGAQNTALRLILEQQPFPDTGALPTLHYRPVSDGGPSAGLTGAPLVGTGSSGVTASDGAGPVLMSVAGRDDGLVNLFNTVGDQLVLGFSEPVMLLGTGSTRVGNLEAAIRFTNVSAEGFGCLTDGSATSGQNFPQQSTGDHPIGPSSATTPSQTLTITMRSGNIASINQFVGVPKACQVGIDPSNTQFIIDAAANVARAHNAAASGSTYRRITPAPISLIEAATIDGVGSVPDGTADGVRLTFDRPLTDSTLQAFAQHLSMHLNGAPLAVTAVTTGVTADDDAVDVGVSIPAGARAEDIEVTYVAQSCTHTTSGTTTTGVTGPIQYGQGYAACVADFTATALDGVGPAVLSAVTRDANVDGITDGVEVRFSEPIGTFSATGWKLGDRDATEFIISDTDPTRATIVVPQGAGPDGGSTPPLSYAQGDPATTDEVGNAVPTANWPTSDGVGPAVVSAIAEDTNQDGRIDRVVATLSEEAKTAGTPVVRYGSVSATSVVITGSSLTATFNGATGTGPRPITVDSGIRDLVENPMTALPFDGVTDQAAPVGLITVAPNAPIPAGDATVMVLYTEAMRHDPIEVTFDEQSVAPLQSGAHTNGWRDQDPAVWEGAITVADDACAHSAGCPVQIRAQGATDLASLAQVAPIVFDTFVDVISPDPVAIRRAHALGTDDVPDWVVNSATKNIRVIADIPSGQADLGTVEVLIDGGSMNIPMVAEIPSGATTVRLDSIYESSDDLQAAFGGEGLHDLSIEICDAAYNCARGPGSQVLVDTVGVEVILADPEEDMLVGGGSKLMLTWDTAEHDDVDSVALAYSANGKPWTSIAKDLGAHGSHNWTVPAIDASSVRVRARSFDIAGNLSDSIATGVLTIDSSKPVIRNFKVPGHGFVPAGRTIQVTWNVDDASLHLADAPIRLKESINRGKTWRPINGGAASTADDGAETWIVPKGVGETRLRLIATDAGNRVTVARLDLIRGVEGVIVSGDGRVRGFGSRLGAVALGLKPNAAVDVAMVDVNSGYVLTRAGALRPFALEGATPPAVSTPKVNTVAVSLLMRSKTSGYIVERNGRVVAFGGAKAAKGFPRFGSSNHAVDAVLLAKGNAGYVVDRFGRLRGFRAGGKAPAAIQGRVLSPKGNAVQLILRNNERSGWIVNAGGGMARFGGAPIRSVSAPKRRAALGAVRVSNGAGYVMDQFGVMRPFGPLKGWANRNTFKANEVRAVATP